MALISRKNLILSAVTYKDEFKVFAHAFGKWNFAQERRESYRSGDMKFNFTEMENAEETLKIQHRNAVYSAINKLYALDRAYFKTERRHVVAKLENFDMMVQALEEVDAFLKAV